MGFVTQSDGLWICTAPTSAAKGCRVDFTQPVVREGLGARAYRVWAPVFVPIR